MKTYLTPIVSGILVSMILIYLITIPLLIYEYRKYNRISVKKLIVIFSFIIYMITAWFTTILPLPTVEEVLSMPTMKANLIPFRFIFDFIENTGFSLINPSTWMSSIKSPSFYTVAFNVLLTLPFGVYLREYFKFSFKKTILFGLLLSLFFEITQFTGLYGFYPKAYRLADIDDLLINTLGTCIGYFIAPALRVMLPKIDYETINTTEKSNLLRRALALFVDILIIRLFTIGLQIVAYFFTMNTNEYIYIVLAAMLYIFYFLGIPYIFQGQTFGMKILNIRIVSLSRRPLKINQILKRNLIFIVYFSLKYMSQHPLLEDTTFSSVISIVSFIAIAFQVYVLLQWIRKKHILFYDKYSCTETITQIY